MAVGEAKNAFLQGRAPKRTEPLYMKPPIDPILQAAGAFMGALLYEIVGSVYGLVDAPWAWASEVIARMLKIGFKHTSLDMMCFGFYEVGHLICLAIFHVDDVLLTWSPKFQITLLLEAFEWGSWRQYPEYPTLVWCGREIGPDVENARIRARQTDFISGTQSGLVAKQRLDSDPPLSAEKRTEFKSCTGSPQYLSGNSRPDVSAPTFLIQKGDLTVEELQAAYCMINHVHETTDAAIDIKGLGLDKIITVGFGDSSFTNAECLETQTGLIVVFSTTEALRGETDASPCDWRSPRTKRAVRSTLAGGSIACDAAADHTYYAGACMQDPYRQDDHSQTW